MRCIIKFLLQGNMCCGIYICNLKSTKHHFINTLRQTSHFKKTTLSWCKTYHVWEFGFFMISKKKQNATFALFSHHELSRYGHVPVRACKWLRDRETVHMMDMMLEFVQWFVSCLHNDSYYSMLWVNFFLIIIIILSLFTFISHYLKWWLGVCWWGCVLL